MEQLSSTHINLWHVLHASKVMSNKVAFMTYMKEVDTLDSFAKTWTSQIKWPKEVEGGAGSLNESTAQLNEVKWFWINIISIPHQSPYQNF